jgi:hypothetical protein
MKLRCLSCGMHERRMHWLAAAASLAGLLALWMLPVPEQDVLGAMAACGSDDVIAVAKQGMITTLRIADADYVDITLFENISIAVGDSVKAEGRLHRFRGRIELVADEIRHA